MLEAVDVLGYGERGGIPNLLRRLPALDKRKQH